MRDNNWDKSHSQKDLVDETLTGIRQKRKHIMWRMAVDELQLIIDVQQEHFLKEKELIEHKYKVHSEM